MNVWRGSQIKPHITLDDGADTIALVTQASGTHKRHSGWCEEHNRVIRLEQWQPKVTKYCGRSDDAETR